MSLGPELRELESQLTATDSVRAFYSQQCLLKHPRDQFDLHKPAGRWGSRAKCSHLRLERSKSSIQTIRYLDRYLRS
jgi:hypothetical protein